VLSSIWPRQRGDGAGGGAAVCLQGVAGVCPERGALGGVVEQNVEFVAQGGGVGNLASSLVFEEQ
jgi:hypothetical protein